MKEKFSVGSKITLKFKYCLLLVAELFSASFQCLLLAYYSRVPIEFYRCTFGYESLIKNLFGHTRTRLKY